MNTEHCVCEWILHLVGSVRFGWTLPSQWSVPKESALSFCVFARSFAFVISFKYYLLIKLKMFRTRRDKSAHTHTTRLSTSILSASLSASFSAQCSCWILAVDSQYGWYFEADNPFMWIHRRPCNRTHIHINTSNPFTNFAHIVFSFFLVLQTNYRFE